MIRHHSQERKCVVISVCMQQSREKQQRGLKTPSIPDKNESAGYPPLSGARTQTKQGNAVRAVRAIRKITERDEHNTIIKHAWRRQFRQKAAIKCSGGPNTSFATRRQASSPSHFGHYSVTGWHQSGLTAFPPSSHSTTAHGPTPTTSE